MTTGARTQLLVWVALLTGCTTVYEGRYDFRDGWRSAEVIEVGTAGSLTRKPAAGCLQGGSAPLADSRYAVVRYRNLHRQAFRVVPIPEGRDVKAGDLVYVNANDCHAPLPPRTTPTAAP